MTAGSTISALDKLHGVECEPLYTRPSTENAPVAALVERMTQRFLGWKLPEHFNPDAGISFDPVFNKGHEFESRHEPIGTNLFSHEQAKEMVEYLLEGTTLTTQPKHSASADVVEQIAQFVEGWNGTTRNGDTFLIAYEIRNQFSSHPTPTEDDGPIATTPEHERAAWRWLERMVESTSDEDPADITYSADQMVDAHMAGATTTPTEAPSDPLALAWLNTMPKDVVAAAMWGAGCREGTRDEISSGCYEGIKVKAEAVVELVGSLAAETRAHIAMLAPSDPVRKAGKLIGEYLPKNLDPSPQAAATRLLAYLDWEGEGYGSVGPSLYHADVRTVANLLSEAPTTQPSDAAR